MKGESLEIRIDEKTGEVEVEVNGVIGKGCAAIQDAISRELGTVVESKTKPEFYQTTAVKKNLTAGR